MIPEEKLSREEQEAIKELNARIKNDLPASLSGNDLVLYKFLKARDFDVDKAEKMLRKHIHWRKVNQVDTLLEDFKPKDFYTRVELTVLGFDSAGRMIIYLPAGNLDTRDILKCTTMNDYMRHFVWHFENLTVLQREENEKAGRHLTQAIFILDLDKLTFSCAISKVCIEGLIRFINIGQDNYPEMLKNIYVINCPSYYVIGFSVVKPLMSKAILNKLKFFGHDGWKEKIVEAIGEDILPAFLGGNRTDPDGNPMCNTFVGHGGMLPECYYLSYEERYFKDTTQVKKTIVSANEKKEIEVQVTDIGSLIEWEYLVNSRDIGFGLDFRPSEEQVESILPVEKFSTPDGTEKGSYRCKKVGRYNVIFDNTHSWITSKEVDYVLKVTKDKLRIF